LLIAFAIFSILTASQSQFCAEEKKVGSNTMASRLKVAQFHLLLMSEHFL